MFESLSLPPKKLSQYVAPRAILFSMKCHNSSSRPQIELWLRVHRPPAQSSHHIWMIYPVHLRGKGCEFSEQLWRQICRVLYLCFGNKWNLTSKLSSPACPVDLCMVLDSVTARTWQLESQLVKSTCQVNLSGGPPKSTSTTCATNQKTLRGFCVFVWV